MKKCNNYICISLVYVIIKIDDNYTGLKNAKTCFHEILINI